jgi:branched-chain amino acid transport system substrate-binding protein
MGVNSRKAKETLKIKIFRSAEKSFELSEKKGVKIMKKKIIILIVLALTLTLLISSISRAANPPLKPIKIGLFYDLTGAYSAMGLDAEKGSKNFIEWVNSKGGIKGHPIEFVLYDTQSDPTKSVIVANKVMDVDNVIFMQGCNSTGNALAVGAIAEEKKVPFTTCTSSEMFEEKLKPYWSFRAVPSGWIYTDWLAQVAKLKGANNLAILYQGAAYGKAMEKDVRYFANVHGLSVVASESYSPVGSEFGAQLSKILSTNPDGLALINAEMAGLLALKQLRQMGYTKPVFGMATFTMKSVREAMKDIFSAYPTYCVGVKADVWDQLPEDDPDKRILEPIAKMYESKYGEKYSWWPAMSTGGLMVFKGAMERILEKDPNFLEKDLFTIRKTIRDEIEGGTKNFRIGYGLWTITPKDHCGAIPGTAFVTVTWKDGKIVYSPELSKIKIDMANAPSHVKEMLR